jgi:acetyltransferase-like isoleucine patch superfamily enzyme
MIASLHGFINALARLQVLRRSVLQVHPSAQVNYRGLRRRPPSRLSIGEGSIFEGGIASDRNGSEVLIGRNTFFGGSTIVTALRVEIGDDVLVSWGCTIVDHDSHVLPWAGRKDDVREQYHGRKNWQGVGMRPVRIADKSWIGFNVIILKGVTVGEGAVVAAGSVVTRDVPAFTLVAGNPARVVRSLDHEAR